MNKEDLTFWEHIEELRKVLIKSFLCVFIGTGIAFLFYPQIYAILTAKLPFGGQTNPTALILLSPTEGMTATLKLSFWIGLVGTSPLWLYTIFSFILPAIDLEKRTFFFGFFILALPLFFMGILFSFHVTLPFANRYLMEFNREIGINMWSVTQYIDYTLLLLLGNGLAFEAAALLLIPVHLGILQPETMKKGRRYFIVGAFVIGALFTPPDVFTQILLAVPLIILYEGAILYAGFRKKEKFSPPIKGANQ